MAGVSIKIDGMTCQHCVMRVKKAIDGIDGVQSSEVDIGAAKVSYDEGKTNADAVKKSITEAGYKVVG